MPRKLKKILDALFYLLPAAAALLLAASLAGVRFLCVLSASMEPELPVGSLIVTVPAAPATLCEGDNITYRLGGTFVTHKAVKIDVENRTVTTQGIANKEPDVPVSFDFVAGKEVLCIPGLGKFAAAVSAGRGRIIFLTAAVSALFIYLIAGILIRNRRGKRLKNADFSCDCSEI